jgi:hypothetical protein
MAETVIIGDESSGSAATFLYMRAHKRRNGAISV